MLVPKRAEFKGKMIKVDIYEAGKHFLKGRPVEDSMPFTPSIAAPLQKGAVSGLMQVNTQIHVHMHTDIVKCFRIFFPPQFIVTAL